MGDSRDAAMNNGLYRLHRVLFIAYISFMVIFALLGVRLFFGPHREDAGLGFVGIAVLPLAAIHYYAAIGARTGKGWGRDLSRLIAAIMLIGFPIGTMIGVYIFRQTGKKWQGENGPVSESEESKNPAAITQKQGGAMNDKVKIALIIGGAAVICVGLWIYFSPYHSCVRQSINPILCAHGLPSRGP